MSICLLFVWTFCLFCFATRCLFFSVLSAAISGFTPTSVFSVFNIFQSQISGLSWEGEERWGVVVVEEQRLLMLVWFPVHYICLHQYGFKTAGNRFIFSLSLNSGFHPNVNFS